MLPQLLHQIRLKPIKEKVFFLACQIYDHRFSTTYTKGNDQRLQMEMCKAKAYKCKARLTILLSLFEKTKANQTLLFFSL